MSPGRDRPYLPGQPHRRRRGSAAGLLVVAALLLAGCLPEPPAAPEPVVTLAPGVAEIRAARDRLGPPLLELSEAAVVLGSALDQVRHDAPRGSGHDILIRAALERGDDVESAAAVLEGAVAEVSAGLVAGEPGSEEISAAVDIARSLLDQTASALEAVGPARASLLSAARLDQRMDALVEVWAIRATRPEIEARLTEAIIEADRLVDQARAVDAWPRRCLELRRNRIRWANLLVERTTELRDLVARGLGDAYDEARDRFRLAPYAEDRAVADSAGRACWDDAAPFTALARTAPDRASALAQALS